jgi:hypothetical protein
MRVQHDGDRGVFLTSRVIPALNAASGAGKNDFGHWRPQKSTGCSKSLLWMVQSVLDGGKEHT